MTTADSYRKIAAELRARALKARTDQAAAELDNLARCYIKLAEQADQNIHTDVAVEFVPKQSDEDESA